MRRSHRKRSFHADSDHLTLLRAYRGWERERRAGRTHERGFLFDNFLSGQTLRMIEKMKTQFKRLLQEVGFYNRRRESDYNENSNNQALVKAVLVAGLYPNIVRVKEGKKGPPKLTTRKMLKPSPDLSRAGAKNAEGGSGRLGQDRKGHPALRTRKDRKVHFIAHDLRA